MEDNNIRTLGICVSRIEEDFNHKVVMGISRAAVKYGCKIVVFNTFQDLYADNDYARGEEKVFRLIEEGRLDALVLLAESIKRESVVNQIAEIANRLEIPLVTVDYKIDGCANVAFEYKDTFEQIVRHVIEEHGLRKINFIAGMRNNEFSDTRVNCYKKVLAENNIEFDETRLGYGDFWSGPTKTVMERFLSDERGLPEAIICCNDTMALTACQCLQEAGYLIPDDVIVTGFDGIEAEKYASPRLTTAETDFDLLGEKVTAVLKKIIKGEEINDEDLKVGFKVRLAQSCGCKSMNSMAALKKISQLYEKMDYTRGHERFMFNYLAGSLACKSYKQMGEMIAKYSENVNVGISLDYSYFEDEGKDNDYPEKRPEKLFRDEMILFTRANNKKLITFIEKYDLSKEYIPHYEDEMKDNDMVVIYPIHYQNDMYGYAYVLINDFDFDFDFVNRYLNNTSQILESIRKNRKLNAAYAEVKELHVHDPLTGLLNRRGFTDKVNEIMEKYSNLGKKLEIFSIDLDGLKVINDQFGHGMGDIAIKAAADVLKYIASKSEDVICARFGGDEYMLVVSNEYKEQVEVDLDIKSDDFNREHDYPFFFRMSWGSATMEGENFNDEGLKNVIREADDKMYEQKRKHKLGL